MSALDKPSPTRPDCLMRSIRIFLALLIALALPMQALAVARMAADCCPMSAEAAPEHAPIGHDCCHEGADASGQACDAGSCCPCGIYPALALHVFLPAVQNHAHVPPALTLSPHAPPPGMHWRPPACSLS